MTRGGAVTDGRLPAIVGTGQAIQRPGEPTAAEGPRGPMKLMLAAARAAGEDSGVPALLERLGWVAVVGGWWRFRDPGRLVATQLSSPGAATALSVLSGSSPQELLGIACERIAAGQLDVALVVGGEARRTSQQLKREGREPTWLTEPGDGDPEPVGHFPDAMLAEARRFGAAATACAPCSRTACGWPRAAPSPSSATSSRGCGRSSARWPRATRWPGTGWPAPPSRSATRRRATG